MSLMQGNIPVSAPSGIIFDILLAEDNLVNQKLAVYLRNMPYHPDGGHHPPYFTQDPSPEWPPSPQPSPSSFIPQPAFRTTIAKRLCEALPLSIEQAYPGIDYGKNGVHFTITLPRFKLPGKLDEIAGKVIEKPSCTSSSTRSPSSAACSSKKPEYGTNTSGKGKKNIIEYSSPNIAKSFHVGHLRSTIIGQFLANLYESCGWDIVKMNYLGDWGTQFGLIATRLEKYGSQEELEKDAIMHLSDVYVKVNKETEPRPRSGSSAWKTGHGDDPEAVLANWRVWRELSVKKYEEQHDTLNVKFDIYNGESMVGKEWQDKALERLNSMGLITDADGAKIVDLSKWKLGSAVGKEKGGTSIYLTQDIGGAIERYENYQVDEMIYVVSSQQTCTSCNSSRCSSSWSSRTSSTSTTARAGDEHQEGHHRVFGSDCQGGREAADVMFNQMKQNEEKFAALEDPETVAQEIGITGVKIQDMVRNDSLASMPQAREIIILLGTYPDVIKTVLCTHEVSGVVTFAFRQA
ncbi:hypothetical protein H0H92_013178 [Tricholoma furcatifolium]|nr:hypothetical protein H0H92_013178 [Tricholoma furcatifolium]